MEQGRTNQSPCRTDPEMPLGRFESRYVKKGPSVDEEKFVGHE